MNGDGTAACDSSVPLATEDERSSAGRARSAASARSHLMACVAGVLIACGALFAVDRARRHSEPQMPASAATLRVRAPAPQSDRPATTTVISEEAMRQRAEARMQRIETALLAQTPDAEWASRAKSALVGLFKTPGFEQSHPVSVECRRSLCRLEARHESVQAYELWIRNFPAHEAGFFRKVSLHTPESNDTGARSKTFFVRQGYPLPAY
jgi:hypothetical protein